MASKRSRTATTREVNPPEVTKDRGTEAATADVQEAFAQPIDSIGVDVEKPAEHARPSLHSLGVTSDDLREALRVMMLSRRTDEQHLILLKQNRSFFHIGASGHEAIQVGIGHWMDRERDWAWTYYRDLTMAFMMGHTPREHFLGAFAKADDPASGGRQMACHHGNRNLHLPTQSSSTGTQFLNAVGCAMASVFDGTNEVTYVASGEGTTSQGEFYEAVNWASRAKLPVIFCIQDNGLAISVPSRDQAAGAPVARVFENHPNLHLEYVDGTDILECYRVGRQAVERARNGEGPTLIQASVVRLLPHSSSDDQRKYRSAEQLANEARRDPILRLAEYMIAEGFITQQEVDALRAEIQREVAEAADWAWEQPDPDPAESTRNNWADDRDFGEAYESTEPSGERVVLVDAVNHAMREEMEHNPRMLIFGEDVADPKGGVFSATRGLSTRFGSARVFNSPLAEASIVGVALGLATRGYKPCIEIQFGDYIWPAFQQLRNEVATLRFRSNGGFSCPMVVRVAVGGYIHGGLFHSQNIEATFSHVPGFYIAYPSNAADAKGLLKSACRMDDPVLFLEHKGLYRMPFSAQPEPDENYFVEFGKGRIVRHGDDLTIVTWGAMVKESFNAAKRIESESGRTVEIIDLRTIVPWDRQLVLGSVARTGRVLVVHEDNEFMGFGAEIAATIAREAFVHLDAPVERSAARNSHIPYHPALENDVLPTEARILDAINRTLAY